MLAGTRGWLRRLAGTFRPRPSDEDLEEELKLHLELAREARQLDGESPDAARRSARLASGGTASAMDALREQRGLPWLTEAVRDAVYAARFFHRAPVYTATLIATLALGIGAVTTVFSVVNALMLRPLPFPESGRLVVIDQVDGLDGTIQRFTRISTLRAWRAESQSFESLAFVGGPIDFTLLGRRIVFFQTDIRMLSDVLQVHPVAGRWFDPEDLGGAPVTQTNLISYELWQTAFGGDPAVLGQRLPDWNPAFAGTTVGVMPPGFWVVPDLKGVDGYFATDAERMAPGQTRGIFGRLRPDVRIEQAEAELTALLHATSDEDPDAARRSVRIRPLQTTLSGDYAHTLYPFMAAVGFVLLIGCANIATLQLNKTLAREPEMATRIALGAGRFRLIRQLLTENVLVAVAGGTAGIALSLAGVRLFMLVAPGSYPPASDVPIDGAVLGFALATTIAAGILFGMVPALRASQVNPRSQLADGLRGTTGRARARLRHAFAAGEIALAVVLLVGAGLMLNSYVRLNNLDLGFDTDELLTWEISHLGISGYIRNQPGDFEVLPASDAFFAALLERLEAHPDIEAAGFVSWWPPTDGMDRQIRALGGADELTIIYQEISPRLLETAGIPVVAGRPLNDRDTRGAAPVALLNETAARQLFEDENPLGRSVSIAVIQGSSELSQDPVREVVGIVADTYSSVWERESTYPVVFVPHEQHLAHHPNPTASLVTTRQQFVVRTPRPEALAASIEDIVHELDPRVAVDSLMPVRERMGRAIADEQFLVRVLGGFAALAILLAAVGIYGVVAYSAAQREREFGIRMALGARRADIRVLVLRGTVLLAAGGVAIGLVSAVILTRVFQTQLPLFQITGTDPLTLGSVCLLLAAVTVLASFVPVWKVGRQSPVRTLNAG